jgi:serine/threonine protein kinase
VTDEFRYSLKSDVWSFGVLMWEIFEYGKVPYTNQSNLEAARAVLKGERLPCPKVCPVSMYKLMLQWYYY